LLGVWLRCEDQLAEALGALYYFVVSQLNFLKHLDRLRNFTAARQVPIRVLGGKNTLAALPVQSLIVQFHSLEKSASSNPIASKLGLLDDLIARHRDEFALFTIELA